MRGDDERARAGEPVPDLLGKVRLGVQGVDVVARLVGEPEPEEVERDDAAAGSSPIRARQSNELDG